MRWSVFLLGPAGCGKTAVWRTLMRAQNAYGEKTIYQVGGWARRGGGGRGAPGGIGEGGGPRLAAVALKGRGEAKKKQQT